MTEQIIKQAPPCFTKEQTEALKRIVGMDDFYPNLWEVKHAGELFKAEIAKLAQDVADGETSTGGAIDIAASKVWSAARRYQSEKQAVQTAKNTAAQPPYKKIENLTAEDRRGEIEILRGSRA